MMLYIGSNLQKTGALCVHLRRWIIIPCFSTNYSTSARSPIINREVTLVKTRGGVSSAESPCFSWDGKRHASRGYLVS